MTSWDEAVLLRENFIEQVIFDLSLVQRPGICYMKKKKMGKEDNRGWRACKESFWEKWLSNERHEGFFGASFFICISNRKSLSLALQWNSVWCWWNDTWPITKIHEHFPMDNLKVCCFSQIHESVKQKGL